MSGKTVYQDSQSLVEYDHDSRVISVSRGQHHKYQLCAQIYEVAEYKVSAELLRDIAVDMRIGCEASRYW